MKASAQDLKEWSRIIRSVLDALRVNAVKRDSQRAPDSGLLYALGYPTTVDRLEFLVREPGVWNLKA